VREIYQILKEIVRQYEAVPEQPKETTSGRLGRDKAENDYKKRSEALFHRLCFSSFVLQIYGMARSTFYHEGCHPLSCNSTSMGYVDKII